MFFIEFKDFSLHFEMIHLADITGQVKLTFLFGH